MDILDTIYPLNSALPIFFLPRAFFHVVDYYRRFVSNPNDEFL